MDEMTKLRGELWLSQGVESMLWCRLGLSAQEMDDFTPTVWTGAKKLRRLYTSGGNREKLR